MARARKTKPGAVLMYGEPDRFSPLLDAEPEAADAPITVGADGRSEGRK